MTKNQITCCYHCEIRQLGCHSTCAIYKEQRAALDAHNEKVRIEKKKEYDAIDSILRSVLRTR